MYVTNITNYYDNIIDLNFTIKCTDNENNIDITVLTFF